MRKKRDSKPNRTPLGLRNMERVKRQKEGEEKRLINNQVTVNWKRFICKDSQRKKVTRISLPPLNQSNTTFDYNNFYYFLKIYLSFNNKFIKSD